MGVMQGLRGPRRAGHSLPVEHLSALSLPMGDDGVVVGSDAEGRPQLVSLCHPSPYEVLLIGSLWTAEVLALRAAATGMRVAVETGRADQWTNLIRAAGVGQQGMTLHEVGRVPALGPTAVSPVLVVRDCGTRPPRGQVAAGSWQSLLTLVPYLSPAAARLLRRASLVGVQRVAPEEAQELGRTMQLAPRDVEALPTLGDGVTLWCTRRGGRYAATYPTDAESGLLGNPRRLD
ncbi:hypothetical protein [Streptomyces boninensis]|uniref:hypothetical protein n=1 Tax=Streptomyces boninensis TaxID=2039455 RepID=UPI003B20ED3C